MIITRNFLEIAKNYQYFVFDVWGVIHDGIEAYPNVVETIKTLKNQGKKICFLSNAPRRANKVSEVLQKYGIKPEFYDFILTSGEANFIDLEKNQKNNFNEFGKKYFYIGPQKDIDLLQGLSYERVGLAQNADFVITTGFDHEKSTLEEKLSQIQEALKHNLLMICVNPDLIVVRKNGDEMLCAGVIAKYYEDHNGKLKYYGKPYKSVYEMTQKFFGENVSKGKMLAIGDGIETDIKGAVDFGIDSVLVTSGILSNRLGIKYNQIADEKKLKDCCDLYKIYPKYVIPNL